MKRRDFITLLCEAAHVLGCSPRANADPKRQGSDGNEQRSERKQSMSQMRLGATCVLVRTMFWNGQVGQAQDMRGKGDHGSLPECSLTQAEPF
jgi:hypothetical protein